METWSTRIWKFILFVGLSWGAASMAEVLPTPTSTPLVAPPKAQTSSAPATLPKKTTILTPDCRRALASRAAGAVIFNAPEKTFYVTAKMAAKPAPGKATPKPRSVLYRLQMDDTSARPHIGLQIDGEAVGVLFGDHAAAVTFVGLKNADAQCDEGQGIAVFAKLDGTGKPFRMPGHFVIGANPNGNTLFNMEEKSLVNFDVSAMQARYSLPLPLGEFPLAVDGQGMHLFSFRPEGPKSLRVYKISREHKELEIPLRDDERLAQNGEYFATITNEGSANAFILKELKDLSGNGEDRQFRFALPQNYSVADNPLVVPHFGTRTVAVYGSPNAGGKAWDKLFFIDYEKNKTIATLILSGTRYIDHVGFDTDGNTSVIAIRDSGLPAEPTVAIKVLDLKKSRFTDFKMEAPQAF